MTHVILSTLGRISSYNRGYIRRSFDRFSRSFRKFLDKVSTSQVGKEKELDTTQITLFLLSIRLAVSAGLGPKDNASAVLYATRSRFYLGILIGKNHICQ